MDRRTRDPRTPPMPQPQRNPPAPVRQPTETDLQFLRRAFSYYANLKRAPGPQLALQLAVLEAFNGLERGESYREVP